MTRRLLHRRRLLSLGPRSLNLRPPRTLSWSKLVVWSLIILPASFMTAPRRSMGSASSTRKKAVDLVYSPAHAKLITVSALGKRQPATPSRTAARGDSATAARRA